MEAEVARIARRALLEHRMTRIFFVLALAFLALPIALDARAENLTLELTKPSFLIINLKGLDHVAIVKAR